MVGSLFENIEAIYIAMIQESKADYYTLYLNSANTGANPNSNTFVRKLGPSIAPNAIVEYRVDWDDLFNNQQSKYKKCYLRCVFETEYVGLSFGSNFQAVTWTSKGVLSVVGLPTTNTNSTAIVLGPLDVNIYPIKQSLSADYIVETLTGTLTATIGTISQVPAAATNTGIISVGDWVYSTVTAVYYQITAKDTTDISVKYIVPGLPVAAATTYNVYTRIPQTWGSYKLDTTSSVPEQILLPTGRNPITVRATNYALSTSTNTYSNEGLLIVGNYGLKLMFECYE
jgi:hypothetical protein